MSPTSDSAAGVTHLRIEGHDVRLTNLSKVLWPAIGLRKAALVDYYVRVSGAVLPHLVGHRG